jgi:hypothetical protein
MMGNPPVPGGVLICLLLCSSTATAQAPSIVLEDGGIQFPDGSVQMTSAVVTDPPPWLMVHVDCDSGDSIAEALAQPADQLVIEIRGICTENVLVSRNNVKLRGSDPLVDGIHAQGGGVWFPTPNAIAVDGVTYSGVRIQNLQLGGAPGGSYPLGVFHSNVRVENCRLQNSSHYGAWLSDSVAIFTDTVITGNANGGVHFGGGYFRCTRCTIENNGEGGLGTGIRSFPGGEYDLIDTTVEGYLAIDMRGGALEVTGSSSIEGIPGDDGQGLAIEAIEHATIRLNGASLTGPIQIVLSDLILDEATTHSMPAEFTEDNEVAGTGGIYVGEGSTLAGDLGVYAFAHGYFESGTSLAGSLECGAGGDAWCEDTSVISGTSNCAQCVKP